MEKAWLPVCSVSALVSAEVPVLEAKPVGSARAAAEKVLDDLRPVREWVLLVVLVGEWLEQDAMAWALPGSMALALVLASKDDFQGDWVSSDSSSRALVAGRSQSPAVDSPADYYPAAYLLEVESREASLRAGDSSAVYYPVACLREAELRGVE